MQGDKPPLVRSTQPNSFVAVCIDAAVCKADGVSSRSKPPSVSGDDVYHPVGLPRLLGQGRATYPTWGRGKSASTLFFDDALLPEGLAEPSEDDRAMSTSVVSGEATWGGSGQRERVNAGATGAGIESIALARDCPDGKYREITNYITTADDDASDDSTITIDANGCDTGGTVDAQQSLRSKLRSLGIKKSKQNKNAEFVSYESLEQPTGPPDNVEVLEWYSETRKDEFHDNYCMPVNGSDGEALEDGDPVVTNPRNRRAEAEHTATQRLAEAGDDGRISTEVARDVALRWHCGRNTRRKRVRTDNAEFVASDAIGVASTPNRGSFESGFCMTKVAVDYPSFVRLLNQYLRGQLEEIMHDVTVPLERRRMAEEFRWTSIVVNQDLKCARHRDGNNAGLSAIIAVGPHRGGNLLYWPYDDRKQTLGSLSLNHCTAMKVSKRVQFFDGRNAHETQDFFGKRTSIVWYAVKNFDSADLGLRRDAEALGFRPLRLRACWLLMTSKVRLALFVLGHDARQKTPGYRALVSVERPPLLRRV